MDIQTISGAGSECNSYLIKDKTWILVDVGTERKVDSLIRSISGEEGFDNLSRIVLTHTHYDHAGGAKRMSELTGAKILVHPSEGNRISSGDMSVTISRLFDERMEPFDWDAIEEGAAIDTGSTKLEVLHLPGHSEGSIGLWEEKSRSLIVGDTIFADGGIGRFDLPTGDLDMLRRSIIRVADLNVRNLYPGHGRIVIEKGALHVSESLGYVRSGG